MKNTITIIITIFLSLNITAQINFGKNIIEGKFSSALGTENVSNGFTSFTTGMGCSAQGDYSFVSGWNINLDGIASFSLGYGNNVNASGAAALGTISSAMGTGAFAIGNKVDALFPYSIAIGKGHSSGHLKNNISSSLMIGFESDIPTFFVGPAYGTGTVGKVGIGTTDPGSRLQVNGNMAVGYENNSSAPDNGMLIKGNVGINTTSPTEKLQVNGSGYFTNNLSVGGNTPDYISLNGNDMYVHGQFEQNGSGGASFYKISIGDIDPSNAQKGSLIAATPESHSYVTARFKNGNRQMLFHSYLGEAHYNYLTRQNDIGIFFSDGLAPGGKNQDAGFVIAPWKDARAGIRIDASGKVGINTYECFEYQLAVDGTIGCREVNVEATSWPDYVFEKEHELKDLKEVEEFINTNKHLPEIPSAKEIEENGVNLAEMNTLLLKKIEEMTLYMIEMKKENEEIKKEIHQLKENL